jgi:ribosomal protein L23
MEQHKRRWSRLHLSLVAFALIAVALYGSIKMNSDPEMTEKERAQQKMVQELFEPGTPPPPIDGSASKTDISSDISDLFEVTPSDIERAYKPKKESKQELAIQRMAQKLFEAPGNGTNQIKRDDR